MTLFTDSTSSTQLLAFSNTSNVEIGSGTPSAPISVQGKSVLQSGTLSALTVTSGALTRNTGSVSVPGGSVATVSVAALNGFGSVSGGGILTRFASGSFNVANPTSTSSAYTYSVI